MGPVPCTCSDGECVSYRKNKDHRTCTMIQNAFISVKKKSKMWKIHLKRKSNGSIESWGTIILWCFIFGFLHQRRWYSFILFPNLQCSVFVNTEEANFEILLLENKQTPANTTHIMGTGQRGDGEQYHIVSVTISVRMEIYSIACSLVPDKNHPFNKNHLVFAPQSQTWQ